MFYHHTAQKSLNKYLIVVVDQSGSMVSAMVQCAILASIFATLPRIVVSLVAFDTNVIDLTPWVADPFEALLRTNLGGGTYGPRAMEHARGACRRSQTHYDGLDLGFLRVDHGRCSR